MDSQASASEEAALLKWLQSKENQVFFKRYVRTESLLKSQSKKFDEDEAFMDFLVQIKKERRKAFVPQVLKYTAIFIAIFALSAAVYLNQQGSEVTIDPNAITLQIHGKETKTIALEGEMTEVRIDGAYLGHLKGGNFTYNVKLGRDNVAHDHTIKVPYGKRFQVTLTDGTIVYLNSGSKLRYPATFTNKDKREVALEGEAYFNVNKNPERPFVVNTRSLQTQVFGTEFNVSAYADDTVCEVVLVEGKVGVKDFGKPLPNTDDLIRLVPNQKAAKGHNGEKNITVSEVEASSYTLWRKGILHFQSDDIVTIIKKLERHFNLRITNNCAALDTRLFTGTFDIENVDEILGVIKTHTPFSYTKDGNIIIIEPTN